LTEILRYKEANSFTYVGNRIKWIDTFDMLKLFTKNAIGQAGKINGYHLVANIRNL
jgi:hypothetical protein